MSNSYSSDYETDNTWVSNAPFRRELAIIVPLMAIGVSGMPLAGYLTLNPQFFSETFAVAVSPILLAFFVIIAGRGLRRPRAIAFFSGGFTLRYRGGRLRSILWAELDSVEVRRLLGLPCAEIHWLDHKPVELHIYGEAAKELQLRFKREART